MGPMGRSLATGREVPTSWNYSNKTALAWSLPLDKSGYSSPIVWEDRLFLTQGDAFGNEMLCVELESGRLLWKVEVGKPQGITSEGLKLFSDEMFASPTPVTDGRHVYAIFGSGDMACFDFSGKKAWQKNFGFQAITYGYASSPILCDGKLIVQLESQDGSWLVALHPQDGAELWRTRRPNRSWATPVFHDHEGRRELLCASITALSGHSLEDGRMLWVVKDALGGECGTSAAWDGSMVYVNSMGKGLRAYRLGNTPSLAWEWADGASEMASPLACEGKVYVASQLGALVCLDGATGSELWRVEASDQFFATPAWVDGKVYAVSRDGMMMVMNAGPSPGEVQRLYSAEVVETSPAFVGNKVIIRAPHSLICYER